MSSNNDCACAYLIRCSPYLYPNSFREYYEAFTFPFEMQVKLLSGLKRPCAVHVLDVHDMCTLPVHADRCAHDPPAVHVLDVHDMCTQRVHAVGCARGPPAVRVLDVHDS